MDLSFNYVVKIKTVVFAVIHEASSPDEKALVEAAASLGLSLVSTLPDPVDNETRRLIIERRLPVEDIDTVAEHQRQQVDKLEYLVDAVLEFDSVRKRMTVMARHPDGTFNIHSKGAESSMLEPEACSGSNSRSRTLALDKAAEFALEGLRTLVYCTRQLSAEEYHQLLADHRAALSSLGKNRSVALKSSMLKIESGLEVVGVTGVEDRLQTGVKECLQDLRDAGIQIWVLTGDKEETAVTVSQAAGHFPERMTLLRITGCSEYEKVAYQLFQHLDGLDARNEQRRLQKRRRNQPKHESPVTIVERAYSPSVEEVNEVIMAAADQENETQSKDNPLDLTKLFKLRRRLMGFVSPHLKNRGIPRKPSRRGRSKVGASGESVGLIIDGISLAHALHPSLRIAFLDLCMSVTTVLCCRMTPLQKAAIIELIHVGLKEGSKQGGGAPVTAAVGDGGNDVSMLLQANVGIGIYGKEGREAVRAADYAIPQFQLTILLTLVHRHLRRLFLVHGQWSYHRISMTMVMFYHKCVTFVTTQIALTFYSGFSANSWFTSIHYTLYNLTFTSLTNLLFGFFEKHLTDEQLLQHPRLYRLTVQHANLRVWYITLWVLDGVWQGLTIFYSVYFFLAGNEGHMSAIFLTLDASPRNQFDFTLCGCACLIYVIISVNIRAMLHTRDFNVVVIVGLVITAVGNLALLMIIQASFKKKLSHLLFT
ncbi:phospholipid-translocating ATPase [Paragonimus westermani]|uniref:Phospholipid-translocating ATPase n=1 Tax=Paragonimus westermani TaxID=34504 RepID=A0A5J4NKZ2_9TREM|nr:phospholipid-translocating ATPase [Paragonimus westermani]